MKPYSKTLRRCSDGTFRIIAARFRIANSPINLTPEKVTKLVLAIAVLHNFLSTKSRGSYLPSRLVDEENLETGEAIPGGGKIFPHLLH